MLIRQSMLPGDLSSGPNFATHTLRSWANHITLNASVSLSLSNEEKKQTQGLLEGFE